MRRTLVLLLVAVLPALAACGDNTGPGFSPVPEEPGEVTLFDFNSSSLEEPSAFDAVNGRAVRTDQSSGWDVLFAVTEASEAELRPRNAVLGGDANSGLQKVDADFESVSEAPQSGYVTDRALTVQEGDVLVGRSRQDPSFRITCEHFYKIEIASLDLAGGTLVLRHLINPACGRTNLVPGSPNPAS